MTATALPGVVLMALVAAACTGAGDHAAADPSRLPGRPAPTATTQPPASAPAEVQPYIEDLVEEVGESHDQFGADPSVALEPGSEEIERFTALHTPASDEVATVVAAYARLAAEGTRLEPATPGQPAYRREVVGEVQPVDRDTVTFATCSYYNHRSASEVLRGVTHPGGGTARRVDGVWLIEDLYTDDTRLCAGEGGVP
jgi:hypothetical protein